MIKAWTYIHKRERGGQRLSYSNKNKV